MLKIGVIGDLFVYKTTDILKLFYKGKSDADRVKIIPIAINEAASLDAFQGEFDILIINNNLKKQSQESLIKSGISSKVTIINSDEKNIYKSLNNSKSIITYGFNNKACVTASSVSESSVLFCIQRVLHTLSGNTVVQQEFSISVKDTEDNIHSILAAVTSALIDDFSVEKICAALE